MDAPPVQYVKTSDGYSIAYSVVGQGEPVVSTPIAVSHLNMLWNMGYIQGLAERFQLIQYDSRGQGLSTRGLPESLTLEDYERDLEAVVDKLKLQRFVLLGPGQFGHVAVRFALRHPDRIRALILFNCRIDRTVPYGSFASSVDLATANWELFMTTLRAQLLTLAPRLSDGLLDIREMTTQADWLRSVGVFNSSNIEALCTKVDFPVLVTASDNPGVLNAIEDAKTMAALIPNSSLVFIREPAPGLVSSIEDFVNRLPKDAQTELATTAPDGLSSRELDVLGLIAAGRSNRQIADELVISHNTVQNHVSNILSKTGLTNRTEAASYARDHGLILTAREPD